MKADLRGCTAEALGEYGIAALGIGPAAFTDYSGDQLEETGSDGPE